MSKKGSASSGLDSLYNCHIVWTTTPNTSANTSTVTVKVYADYHAIDATVTGSVSFNGSVIATASVTLSTDDTSAHSTLIASGSTTISHESDGTLSAKSVSGAIEYNLTSSSEGYIGTRSCSTNATFETIPRATTTFTFSNIAFGSSPTVAYTPNASTFKHVFEVLLTGDNGTRKLKSDLVAQSGNNPYTFTETITETWAQLFPSSKTATVTGTVYTYDASNNLIGSSSKSYTLTYTGTPTVATGTVSRKGTSGAFYPNLVQDVATAVFPVETIANQLSTVKTASLYSVSGSTETLIKTSKLTDGEVDFEVAVDWSGSKKFRVKATDARGNVGTSSDLTVSAYSYTYPKLSLKFSQSGTTLTMTRTMSITLPTLSGTTIANAGTIKWDVKKLDGTAVASGTISNQSTGEITWTTTAPDETSTYVATVYLYDATGTSHQAKAVKKTAIVCFSRMAGGKGAVFFDEATSADSGRLRVNGDILTDELLEAQNSDGTIVVKAGASSADSGYIRCQNSAGGNSALLSGNGDGTGYYGMLRLCDVDGDVVIELNANDVGSFAYIIDYGTSSYTLGSTTYKWYWREWSNGRIELWTRIAYTNAITTTAGSIYTGAEMSIPLPSFINSVGNMQATVTGTYNVGRTAGAKYSSDAIKIRVASFQSETRASGLNVDVFVSGT